MQGLVLSPQEERPTLQKVLSRVFARFSGSTYKTGRCQTAKTDLPTLWNNS